MNGPYDPNDPASMILSLISDPAMAQQLAQLSGYADRMGLAGEQGRRGAALFGTPGAEGAHVGGTYRAASPLEHLGVLAMRGVGARRMNDADARREALIGGMVGTRGALGGSLADAMRRARAASATVSQQPQDVSPDTIPAPTEY